jgi:hypothetical protein
MVLHDVRYIPIKPLKSFITGQTELLIQLVPAQGVGKDAEGGYVNHHIGFVPGAHKRSCREHVVVVRDLKLAPIKRVVILTIPFV